MADALDAQAAELEGPITIGRLARPVSPRRVDLEAIGYVEEEWFAAGTACAYVTDALPAPDGHWNVRPTDPAAYRTRFVVRRPREAARFSGTVVVEWLNVSAVETDPDWLYLADVIADENAAWVGVSAQALGIVGGQSLLETGAPQQQQLVDGGIRARRPERYGSLEHPGDQYAFDIYAQVGAAVRSSAGAPVFDGVQPITLVAVGSSQSASFLTSYLNAVQPITGVYDGFFVHSRGGGAATLDGSPNLRVSDVGYQIRDDLDARVLVLETETDVGPMLRFAAARQPDTSTFGVWEVAGTAHADTFLVGREFALCPGGINDGPHHWVAKAAFDALVRWVTDGTEPPRGPRLRTGGRDGTAIERDAMGLALGGVRTPSVDVPLSILSGDPSPGCDLVCALFGSSTPIDPTVLTSLYPTTDAYLERFDAALGDAVTAGFVRSADRAAYAAEARELAEEAFP